jgi:DNA-binding response OmpR family regulator
MSGLAHELNAYAWYDSQSTREGEIMIRLLTIDGDRNRAQALAMECLDQGVAVRMAETLCEGVRYLLNAPVSLVLAEAGMLRLASGEQARLFEAVAPGVPVILTVDAGAKVEDLVSLELQGFRVMTRPFALGDLLAKIELPSKGAPARRDARERVDTACR